MGVMSRVHRALLQRNFVQDVDAPADCIRYAGVLHCNKADIPVRLEITDTEFTKLPTITLIKRPEGLPPVCGHLGPDNELCYASSAMAYIDIHRADSQILDCISNAEDVINRLMCEKPLEDMRDEFHNYWHGGYILTDLVDGQETANVRKVNMPDGRVFLLVGDRQNVQAARLMECGASITDDSAKVFILRSSSPPVPDTTKWPPATFADIAKWLRITNKPLLSEIEKVLTGFHKTKSDSQSVLFIIQNGWVWFAFSVVFGLDYRSKHRNSKDWVHRVLWVKGAEISIARFLPVRIDQQYLVTRNLAGRSLVNKNILLSGCGTIGGYLAHILVSAGAGTGTGQLTLVDPQILLPGNVGRHQLSITDVLKNKAEALKEMLCKSNPGAKIVSIAGDVRNASFRNIDLLIDATGEEPLSNAINLRYLDGDLPPVLYTWIEGPGTAVRCLLVDSPKYGCYRCLKTAEGADRYSPLESPIDSFVMGQGCDSYYVPFPAATSMAAAALAGQAVIDWVNDRVSPRLRTNLTSQQNRRHVKDKDLTPTQGCPACAAKK